MKKTYIVSSDHNVHEDSYTDGQQKWVNSYELELKVFDAKDPKEAVEIYYENQFGKKFDQSQVVVEDGGIYDSFLADENGLWADDAQIERWKKGEETLYCDDFRVTVEEVQVLDLEKYF